MFRKGYRSVACLVNWPASTDSRRKQFAQMAYPENDQQSSDHVLLLRELRQAQREYSGGAAGGNKFQPTAASSAGSGKLSLLHLKDMDDFGCSSHQATVFDGPSAPKSTPFNTDQTIQQYGLGKPFTGVGRGSWEARVWDYKDLPQYGAEEYALDRTIAIYSYDPAAKR
ncbi:uncharacterized protein BDW70DRAFT_170258 [Aspergillus foveolatus]|uniref:uncharacterized protein n=1 Tax=Aspergillus foveolatus TaxID=210207 RepID=UPI003CCE4874